MIEETHFVVTPDGPMGVVVKWPSSADGPFPVILMFHDGPGLREANHTNARRLAMLGYFVVMPDRYHRHRDFFHIDPALMRTAPDSEEVKEFRTVFTGTTDEHMRTDVKALLAWLGSQVQARRGPMAVIGYCIGARTVVRTMADYPDRFVAGACMHPSFCASSEPDSPHLSVATLGGPIYVGIGDADTMQSVEMNQPFLDAVLAANGKVDIFEGADHGFTVPGGSYHDDSANQAYREAIELFDSVLK
jgi:carboxymethylenebutenolidase